MRRTARFRAAEKLARQVGLASAYLVFGALCGCSWNDLFPARPATIANADAIDRALKTCSLTARDQPFHLVLEVTPPSDAEEPARNLLLARNYRAHIEIFWLNPITYRTVIRSRDFSQTRIVNGHVVEEHNTGDFYPRWIQNFVDAILDPIPRANVLRKISGSVPIGVQDHACISGDSAEVCFLDAEPRIATGSDPSRSIWFDNYAPFGQQQIARTLTSKLPGNLLLRAHILVLAPLDSSDYALLKAKEFTLPDKIIATELVSQSTAESRLQIAAPGFEREPGTGPAANSNVRQSSTSPAPDRSDRESPATVLVRTDRTGRVREAYRETPPELGAADNAISRALALHFKPLIVNGTPRQMEAVVALP